MQRRDLIRLCMFGGTGLMIGGGIGMILEDDNNPASLPVFLGHSSDFPEYGIINFPEHNIAVLCLRRRIAFISTKCSHMGCKLRLSDKRLICPCHGGVFDIEGNPVSGPPKKALMRFEGMINSKGIVYCFPWRIASMDFAVERI